ncbi:MAG: T9SS type A sorting domain-containing protein [Bacteroidota bacterium]
MIAREHKLIAILFWSLLLAPAAGYCQLWFATRGQAAQDDRAWGVDTDSAGNIYWSVEQKDLWPYWYYNIYLYKITPEGNQVWQTPSWGGLFNDIAFVTKVSGSSVYLAGRIDSTANPNLGDALVVCRNASDGNYRWHYTYDQGFGYEEIDGISIQPDGIFLTGWTVGETTGFDFLVQKISLEGQLIWSRPWDYNQLGKMDGANGNLAIDNNFIYAAGHVGRTNIASLDGDMGLACFNRSDGTLQWSTTWGGSLFDDGLGLTLGSDSMLYVVGYTASFGKGSQFYLNKFSRTGELHWSRIWGGTGAEDCRAVVAGPDSLIYAIGATSSFGHDDYDIFVLKYSPAGVLIDSLLWGGTGKETAHDAVLAGDYLYITGETWSYGKDAMTGNGHSEGLLLKVNARTMEGPDASMSIQEVLLAEPSLRIFPDPAKSSVTIEFPDTQNSSLTLFSLRGQPVLRQEHISGNRLQLDVSHLPKGIYLVSLKGRKSGRLTGRLMIK